VRLLAYLPLEEALPALRPLFDPREPPSLELAALRALSAHEEAAAGPELVLVWAGAGPGLRREALEALLARRERLPALLDAIEDGRIPAGSIEPARRAQLLETPDEALRARAREALGREGPGDRKSAVEAMRGALALVGD